MYYVRYPLSLRNVEDILHKRGIDICHETVRYWWNKLGPVVAKELKKKRPQHTSKWRWHIDEAYIRLSSLCYVTKRRDRRAAIKVLKKLVKQHGKPKEIITDKLRSYGAALRDLDMKHLRNTKQYANNQVENSHLHFRRREKMMNRFRSMGSLQKFIHLQSTFQNHFNLERHLEKRNTFKDLRQSSFDAWNEIFIA